MNTYPYSADEYRLNGDAIMAASNLAKKTSTLFSSKGNLSLAGLNNQGCIALSQGQGKLAQKYFEEALQSAPDDADSLLNLAFCQLSQSQIQAAHSTYQQLLNTSESSYKVDLLNVYLLVLENKLEEALVPCRKLFRLFPEHPVIQRVFSEICRYFIASRYLPELEKDVIALIEQNTCYSEAIFPLACSLLIHKFDLNNDEALIDLQVVVSDPLLLCLMGNCEINSPALEALITGIRQHVFIEAMALTSLPESYQAFVIACGLQSANNGYIFSLEDDEAQEVQRLNLQLMQTVQHSFKLEDISAACLLVAMYEPLNQQAYSFYLLKYDESDWPPALAKLIYNSLFKPLKLNEALLCQELERPDYSRIPHWALNTKPSWQLANPVASHRTLVISDGDSGYRALSAASSQQDKVDVITHDPVEAAYLNLQAESYAMDNIRQLNKEHIELCSYDWVDSGLLLQKASRPHQLLNSLLPYLDEDTVLTVDCWTDDLLEELQALKDFACSKDLSPNIETIRALRKAVQSNCKNSAWARLCHSPVFYDSYLLQQWVFSSHSGYTHQQISALCEHNGLVFLGYVSASGINPGLGGQDKIRMAFKPQKNLTKLKVV